MAVLDIPQSHWTANPAQHKKTAHIIERAKHLLDLDEDRSTPTKPVENAIENFSRATQ